MEKMNQQNLWQLICNKHNFHQAWTRVRTNLGAPGIDRVSIAEFEQNLDENISLLLEMVQQGSYEPLPYLEFKKAKLSGKHRILQIPAVRDRLVQEALLIQIRPIFEKIFLNCSYAYRPRKSAFKAVERVERNIKKGRPWVVDADIEGFFDNVDCPILLQMVSQTISDKKIIRLIELEILYDKKENLKGIPQGSAISPLLANIYLHILDEEMIRADWNYVRFADDLVVLCHDEIEAKQALQRTKDCLEKKLKLNLNLEKTRIIHASTGFIFLGYHFDLSGKRPSTPAVEKIKARIESVINQASDSSESQLKSKLDDIIRGWTNYFQLDQKNKQELLAEIQQKLELQSHSIPLHILTAALALNLGDTERAKKTIDQAPIIETEDADIQFQWGVVCQLSNKQQEALDAFHSAFRLNSDHPEASYQLGIHYLHRGELDKAIRFLQKAIQVNPNSGLVHFALGTALENYSLTGPAQKAFARAYQLDPKLRKFKLKSCNEDEIKEQHVLGEYSTEDISHYLSLFRAREGVFSRQWTDSSGRLGYTPIFQPLSEENIKQHLEGEDTFGIYLLRSDNTVNQIVIDIDISRQVRSEISINDKDLNEWQEITQMDAKNIVKMSQKIGVEAYIEDSGFKGRHVWYFLSEPMPARDAITFIKKILEIVGEPPPGLNREIFPKEPRVMPKALGSMIKLPLGLHKSTDRRCLFLQADGAQYKDQFYLIRSIKRITQNQFHFALDMLRQGITEENRKDLDTSHVDEMIEKCNVLKYLVEKVEKERQLTHVDRLTLLHTLGHLGEPGKYMIHKIIGKALNYDRRITERWIQRLKGSPVSCPKIREWQSHITPSIGCYCTFPKESKCYPTPLLHINPKLEIKNIHSKKDASEILIKEPEQSIKIKSSESDSQTLSNLLKSTDIDKLVNDYIELRQEFRKLDEKRKNFEQQLDYLFNEKHCDRMVLKLGTLRRVKEGNDVRWIIEI